MDISKIDFNFIELFNLCYTSACEVYGENPENKPDKEQNKIRKWIDKVYFDGVEFPKKVQKLISKDVSNTEFFDLLKSCSLHVSAEGTKQKQLFEKSAENLSEPVKQALWRLIEDGLSSEIKTCGNDVHIEQIQCPAYCSTLIFKNATGIPENYNYLSFIGVGNFIKDDEGYGLLGVADNWENETETPFVMRFSDVQIVSESFNAMENIYYNDPWYHLLGIANNIIDKQYDLYNYEYNAKEKELLPLLKELRKIHWVTPPQYEETADFPVFRSYVKKYGDNKLLAKLQEFEKEFCNVKKRYYLAEKLVPTLNQQRYEPLWRAIYNEIAESQAEYTKVTDERCDKDELNETRAEIQRLMEAHGYSGTYPDFIKRGEMKKIHITDSYDMTYFVGREKNVEYRIHCTERIENGHLMIEFLCGTAFLHKREKVEDIYSCTFNSKGRRISHQAMYVIEHNLEEMVQIAVKKAELLKLTKYERSIYANTDMPAGIMLLLGFLFMGFFFAVFMTLGMLAICSIITAIVVGPQEIPEMITVMPWWQMFVFAFVGFGGAMTVLEIYAKRK